MIIVGGRKLKKKTICFSVYLLIVATVYEEFHRKTGYIHFGQFEIFEI